MLKVIVAGGRDFGRTFLEDGTPDIATNLHHTDLLYGTMDRMLEWSGLQPDDIEVISGNAKGADQLGEMWADEAGACLERFPAEWNVYGKRAGPVRNEQMADYADVLVAFWDGKSKGTKHIIQTALTKGLEVHVYRY